MGDTIWAHEARGFWAVIRRAPVGNRVNFTFGDEPDVVSEDWIEPDDLVLRVVPEREAALEVSPEQPAPVGGDSRQRALIDALRILQDRTIGSPEACQRAIDVFLAGLAAESEGETTKRPSDAARAIAEFHVALGDARYRGNAALRLTLHEEEHEELLDELSDKRLGIDVREPKADADVDRAKLARELADVVYISYGTAHAFGIDLDAALAEIHRATMSKLDPATMVVRGDGKILKPPGFVPPDMSPAVGGE